MGSISGLPPRGSRAHRHAAGTNTTACVLLQSNGMAVGREHLGAVARWGPGPSRMGSTRSPRRMRVWPWTTT
eukprot:189236-Chlamydomonas_euryale.AAC.1